jgi:Holliday junction resolvase RusA-like endonuclease
MHIVWITPDESLRAQAQVRAAFQVTYPRHQPDATSLWSVSAVFYRETMVSADVDNLLKTVLDGLTGHLWADDRQVADLHGTRHLGVGRGHGRTVVTARAIGFDPGESATLEPLTTNGG